MNYTYLIIGVSVIGFLGAVAAKDHHESHFTAEDIDELEAWANETGNEICYKEEDDEIMPFKCKKCCGEEMDEYCCGKDESDEHDRHRRVKSHKVVMAFVFGGLCVISLVVVTIVCCVVHQKNKKQMAEKKKAGTFSGVVIADPSYPTKAPMNTKFTRQTDDLYSGQNDANYEKIREVPITEVISSAPPYSEKY
ncbi:hypothetical protein ACF0H5_013648 [Mactra antiquata]